MGNVAVVERVGGGGGGGMFTKTQTSDDGKSRKIV